MAWDGAKEEYFDSSGSGTMKAPGLFRGEPLIVEKNDHLAMVLEVSHSSTNVFFRLRMLRLRKFLPLLGPLWCAFLVFFHILPPRFCAMLFYAASVDFVDGLNIDAVC